MKILEITKENYEEYRYKSIDFNGDVYFKGINNIECSGINTHGGSICTFGGSLYINGGIITNGGKIITHGGSVSGVYIDTCLNSIYPSKGRLINTDNVSIKTKGEWVILMK